MTNIIKIGDYHVSREIWDQWMNSLYDETLPKARGSLQNLLGMCCLGKGVKVAIPEERQEKNFEGLLIGTTPKYQPYCPKWLASINSEFHKLSGKDLIQLNDGREGPAGRFQGMTHPEIADLLISVFELRVLD